MGGEGEEKGGQFRLLAVAGQSQVRKRKTSPVAGRLVLLSSYRHSSHGSYLSNKAT
jgi:hypothetical protein